MKTLPVLCCGSEPPSRSIAAGKRVARGAVPGARRSHAGRDRQSARRRRRSVCVCDLNAAFDLSQPTISHHLKVLRDAGLVESSRRGTWAYYRLVPDAVRSCGTRSADDAPHRPLPCSRGDRHVRARLRRLRGRHGRSQDRSARACRRGDQLRLGDHVRDLRRRSHQWRALQPGRDVRFRVDAALPVATRCLVLVRSVARRARCRSAAPRLARQHRRCRSDACRPALRASRSSGRSS